MSGTRRTITKLVLIVVIIAALTPAAASAGSLLSGYGAPGEGNQAILGSALLKGPSGKGGSGGGSGAGGPGRAGSNGSLIASATEGQSVSSSRGSGRSTDSSSSRSSKSGGKQRHVDTGAGNASNSASQPYKQTFRASTDTSGSGGSQPLGLSGADLLYILLALVVLALTGVVTRGLVRANVQGDGGPAQAMRRRTRLTN